MGTKPILTDGCWGKVISNQVAVGVQESAVLVASRVIYQGVGELFVCRGIPESPSYEQIAFAANVASYCFCLLLPFRYPLETSS